MTLALRKLVMSVAVVALALIVVLTSSGTSGAQTSGSVELVAQSSWVDDGGIFSLQVRVAGAPPDSTIRLRVLSPWTERADFLRQEVNPDRPVLLELDPVVLGDAQETSNEVLGLEFLVDGPNTRLDDAISVVRESVDEQAETGDVAPSLGVLPSDGGSAVYPVEVSLLDANGELADSFVTSMIELPRQDLRTPLGVSIVLEANAEPSAVPAGNQQLSDREIDDLRTLSIAIAQHPNADIALSVSPQTLVSLSNDDREVAERILNRFADSLDSAQLLPNPLTEVEEQAWFNAELTSEIGELYEAGSDATIEAIGIEPERGVILLDRTVDATGIAELRELGVQGAIVRPAQLSSLDEEVFPEALTTRFLLASDEPGVNPLPALTTDAGLSSHFTNPGGPVLNANQLLADLVLLSLQNSGGRQSVVVNPPRDWRADGTFLNVLLSGLERVPALAGASPLQALGETETTPRLGIGSISGPLVRELTPRVEPEALRSFRTEFSQARNAIDSWSTVIGSDTSSGRRLDELLFLSTDHRMTEAERDSFIEAIFAQIDLEKDSAITTPESRTINLTGRDSEVPIIVENNLDTDATVLMLLSSDELDFPEGSEITRSLEPGPNRIVIPITARASGDSPIRIQVLSPDRLILLGSSEVLIRTFAFSGVGIAIGVVAIIVLLAWWLRHVRFARATVDPPTETAVESSEEVIGV